MSSESSCNGPLHLMFARRPSGGSDKWLYVDPVYSEVFLYSNFPHFQPFWPHQDPRHSLHIQALPDLSPPYLCRTLRPQYPAGGFLLTPQGRFTYTPFPKKRVLSSTQANLIGAPKFPRCVIGPNSFVASAHAGEVLRRTATAAPARNASATS